MAILAALLLSLSSVSSAYYYWIYFPGRTGPFQAYPAKFDLSTLPDKTVSYFISDQPPGKLVDGDNYDALVSQIRLAAETWNGVATSDIRLRFGGFETLGAAPQATPGIDVVFDDDMPPGLLAQTIPSMPKDVGDLTKGPGFVPILRSKLQLRSDLTVKQQASYSDAFFLTMVHEFGHTLGLQHSTVSATMSTSTTRATTKARPLAPDDIAGISHALPGGGVRGHHRQHHRPGSAQREGSEHGERGRAVLERNGDWHADQPRRQLSHRRDSARRLLRVYPAAASARSKTRTRRRPSSRPRIRIGGTFAAFTGFAGQFFPHTRDWQQAAITTVNAGASAGDVNFDVEPRTGPSIYDLETSGLPGPVRERSVRSRAVAGFGLSGLDGVRRARNVSPEYHDASQPGMSLSAIGPAATAGTGVPRLLRLRLPLDRRGRQ